MNNHSALKRNLKEVVYGGSDGIVTTFAVVAGFSGAGGIGIEQYGFFAVLLFGFANLFADASSMGLGDFLSNRSQRDVYEKSLLELKKQLKSNPQEFHTRALKVLNKKGMEESDAKKVINNLFTTPTVLLDMMLRYEQGLGEVEEHPLQSAFATFISFIVFGLIPLLPFLFLQGGVGYMFSISVISTTIALILLGLLRWKVSGIHAVRAVVEALVIGGLAASIAYGIGVFLGSM